MQRVDMSLNGQFGSFVSTLIRKKRIEEKTILESKIFQNSIGQLVKDEGTLNEIIHPLIADEFRKHRDKKRISIKRTYSDSKTVVHEKTNKRKRQPINLNPLVSSLKRNKQSKSCLQENKSEKTKGLPKNGGKNATFPDETVELFMRKDVAGKAKEVEILRAETETAENLKNVDPILREVKLDSHNTQIPIDNVKTCKKKIQDKKDTSTQTEHYYLVRTIRSCPVQNKQSTSSVHLRLNQSTNAKVGSNNLPTKDLPDINLFSIILRKASDNLIFEKHKGCTSPSYIPSPERFRWKYILPSSKK